MSQSGGAAGESGEPEAKVLHTKRLYRAVVEAVHRLDLILGNKAAYQDVFKPENISLRNKLRELCVKLMFLHPVDYGRKAEELLWRKVYYEVIQLIKTNKKHIHSRSTLECAYRTHLVAGIGFYQHLLLYIQSHYQLELQCCIDWTHVTDPLIGCKKPVSASEKEMEWAQMACHRCLVYLGDLARYQNELAGVDTELLAERFYYQALSVAPQIGMPFNQLGTLAGSKYYNVEATYCYLRCSLDSELTSLCQSVLEDFNLCLFYLPSPPNLSSTTEDEEEYENGYSFLPDLLIFRMVIICLMSVHSLKRAGSKQYSAAIAFTLALFSHLINHVNIRLQAELEEGENPVPAFQSDGTDDQEPREPVNSIEKEAEAELANHQPSEEQRKNDCKKSKKYSRLSCLRRRRHPQKVDESDLSEGFDSDSSQSSIKGSDGSESGSEKSDEEAEAAFDVETDSDMNSQESRSDLEDMEDEPGEEGSSQGKSGPKEALKNCVDGSGLGDSKNPSISKTEAVDPAVNGPASLSTDASIASNLQAMSTQLFQTKRCFRLAPTFSNILLKPNSEPPALKDGVEGKPCVNGDLEKPSLAEQDDVSDSEESISSNKSCRNERSLQEKLEIVTNEGLLLTVKVFLDWLRTNTDLIIMCAQSSQSLWNRLSVLLNLLPSAADLQESGLALCDEVKDILSDAELPDLKANLLLPEDVALRNLPPLKNAHKRFNFEQDRPIFSAVEESVVRICCIRSFGHFITHLQSGILQFNSELGIFISIAQSEQDNLLHQAQAQFHMAAEEARRNRLMRDMAQLRLQLEVSQLEGSLQQPKAQSAMSPYLVPDTQALCQHLALVKQLATSGRFIIIIPRTVIDGLDFLKKENAGARDSIRYLEAEFKKGNRYIRCQKDVGKSFERHKLKRQDLDAWNLYKILDSCKQLTVSQGSGEDDTTGMVTIITGFQLEDPSSFSVPMQSAIQAATNANIEIKNVLEFYKQWKEMG
ncbi:protein SMG5 isoform X3 [Parus major]|uniref:protein SMG5 isoform X3 n=1 Tax=Parus major TaxID=9157 RepID=UPI0014442E7E|nr:protein SMG5 isoform X3 [Parus major]